MRLRINLNEDYAEAWQLTLTEINWLFVLSIFNLLIRFMPDEILMLLGTRIWGMITLVMNLILFFFFLLDVRNAVIRGDYYDTMEGAKHFGLRYAILGILFGGVGFSLSSGFVLPGFGRWGLLGPLFFAYCIPSLLVEDVGILQAIVRSVVFSLKNIVEHALLLVSLAVLGFILIQVSGLFGPIGGFILGFYAAFAVIIFFVFYTNRAGRMAEPWRRRYWII